MTQVQKALAFKALHIKGTPLVLWNIWDAGSAKAVAQAGANAIATGSWSVAAAQGYADGEALPMAAALHSARQIVGAVDLPVSIDFEGGYAVEADEVARNVAALLATGAVGLNFEDQIVGGEGLHELGVQTSRIKALRATAEAVGVPLFINARTDVFLKAGSKDHADHMEEALERAAAYAIAGADGFFAPGLTDLGLIHRLAQEQGLPLNVMRGPGGPKIADLAQSGVARVSHGPNPFRAAMATLKADTEV